MWDYEPFFTVESNDAFFQVIISEPNFKNDFDILHEHTNITYNAFQEIRIDPNYLAQVKIVEFKYDPELEIPVNKMDYATYRKDLMQNSVLTRQVFQEKTIQLLNNIKPSYVYVNQLSNDYHESTIGRYKLFVGATINDIQIYEIEVSTENRFLQVIVNLDWSFVNDKMESVGRFGYIGKSGKFAFNPSLSGTKNVMLDNIFSVNDISFENAFNLSLHDAILSSYLYFLDDNQEIIMENIK